MTILIVDDEPQLVSMFQDFLERDGHTCLTASDAIEADLIRSTVAIDALAVDLGLPGPDSLEWLESLTLERPELRGRCVVMTGRLPSDADLARIVACGAHLLLKPFPLHEFRAALLGGDAVESAVVAAEAPHDEAPRKEGVRGTTD